MSWVKKGAVVRLIGGAFLVWAFAFFLFDPILKFALVRAGRAAAGAEVDVASVRTRWLKGTLEIRGVQVADRSEPMKNVVELSRAAFALDPGAALRGRTVIREAAVEGLRFGTPRSRSGALMRTKPSKMEKAVEEKLAPAAVGGVETVKAKAVGQIDATKLQSLRQLDAAKAKASDVEARWNAKKAETDAIAKDAQAVADQVKALGDGGNSPADIARKVQQSQDAQKKIKELLARVDAQRAAARQDLSDVQGEVQKAAALRDKDVNGLLAAAGLPTLDAGDLSRRLLGAPTAARVTTALHWVRWTRERASANKTAAAAAPPPPARRAGVNVEFPRKHVYPRFLLENAKLSGTLDKLFMGQDMTLSGVLSGVTSNPALYGKPATLELGGQAAGGLSLKLSGRLDQQADPVGVGATFEGTGFSLAGTSLGDAQVGGRIADGRARVTGHLSEVGDEWKGEALVEASGVRLEPAVTLPGPAAALVSDALKSMKTFQVRIGISGRQDEPALAFSSNIGEVVAGAMKKAVAGQVEAQRKALQAQVDALYQGKLKDVQSQTGGLSAKILGPLDAQRAALDRTLQDAIKKAAGGGRLPDFRKLFK